MDLKTHNRNTLELLEWAEFTTRIKVIAIFMGIGILAAIWYRLL